MIWKFSEPKPDPTRPETRDDPGLGQVKSRQFDQMEMSNQVGSDFELISADIFWGLESFRLGRVCVLS